MNKDVIYIDVDDDVTAVIGKIKSAKEKIVAIVPPKRPGALQSAVNLRLLDRMAKAEKKQLVIISNNQALVALAANAQIPVAKNLQSKPELAEIPALLVDDGDDIIDGNDVPVGEYAAGIGGLKVSRNDGARDNAIETIDVEKDSTFAPVTMGSAAKKNVAKKSGSKIKIPNFDSFRKKLFVGIGALVVLVGVLVWAFVFAPAATVIITARTSDAPVSTSVTLSTTAASNYGQGIVKASAQTEKKSETIEFDATGTKDIGEAAKGTVRVSNSSYDNEGTTLPAGTQLTSNSGNAFTTDSPVTFTASNRSAEIGITAAQSGTSANGASGSMRGAPNGVSVVISGSTSGGTAKEVKVPTASDIERAQGDIIGRSTDAEKKALAAKFTGGEKVIDSSFTIERAQAVSAPALNAEAANGKATLAIETTYTLYAVAKSDLETYLTENVKEQILDKGTQRVYESGYANAAISNFQKEGDTLTAGLTATGKIGPEVDEAEIKDRVKGQIFGDAQSSLESIDGIQEVDVKFSYFWVRTIPNDVNKIKVEFTLQDE